MRSVRFVSLALAIVALFVAAPRPAPAQWTNRQRVYAPLMLALNVAYEEWLAGPLGGHAPPADSFTATLDATKDPYRVAFALTKSLSTAEVSYPVPSGTVIDSSGPQLPDVSKGPLTLSGSYVLAYIAAHGEHAKLRADDGSGHAFESSTGSAVVITTFQYQQHPAILVGFSQRTLPTTGPLRTIGCYKEEYYLVDPITFAAKRTTIGCPR